MSARSVKNKQMIYGITGSIASGKSTVTNYLLNKGFLVFDSDKIVKDLWENNSYLINKVKNKYNIDISTKIGKQELGNLIFNNSIIKEEIESLVHPLVFNELDNLIKLNKDSNVLFIDMPLLFEVNYHLKVDKVILVNVTLENQINRLMIRDKISRSEALNRINSQMPLEEKVKLSNYIINNDSNIKDLEIEIDKLLEVIKNENK